MIKCDLNFREFVFIFKKRKFKVILIAILLGFFGTAFSIIQAPDPIYVSVSKIKFEKETPLEGGFIGTMPLANSDDILTQTFIIKSYTVLQEVARELGLIPQKHVDVKGLSKKHIIGVIENLQSKVKVTREDFTNILHIEVTDKDPMVAQRLANAIAREYKDLYAEQQMNRTTETIKDIGDRLREVNIKLRESEDAFNRFSQDNQLISIDLHSENFSARTLEIQKKIREFQEDKAEFQDILDRLNQFIKDPSHSDLDFHSMKAISQYQNSNDKLRDLMTRKNTLLKSYTSKHPEVQAIDSQIIGNTQKMISLLQVQIKDIERRENNLWKEMARIENMTQALMEKEPELDRLRRTLEMHKEMIKLLEQKMEEALIRRAEKSEKIKIINPAMLTSKPINPPKTMAMGAIGVLIGLFLGLLTALIVEMFGTSLGAIQDVEATLGTQVLGVIPHADVKDIHNGLKERFPDKIQEHAFAEAVNLISHFVPKSMMAESFRSLRTNIQFKDMEKNIKTIAIASTTLQEGKTMVAMNLAITMAQGGMKVLLVECDLRKPMVAKRLGLERGPGLTDILHGSYAWRDTVKGITDLIMGKMTMEEIMITPGLDNLHIITSGAIPPNPVDLVGSGRMLDFIQEAKKAYDIVLFDSAPILPAADATILEKKVDGVLLVYRAGKISRGLLKRSSNRLEQVNCNIIGVVLNGMEPEISPEFQNYKHDSYYSNGGPVGNEKRKGEMKGSSFLSKRIKGQGDSQTDVDTDRERKRSQEARWKKSSKMKLILLFIALVFLSVGLLLQNGIIDPFEWIHSEKPVEKKQTNPNIKRKVPPLEKKRVSEPTKTALYNTKKISENTVPKQQVIDSEAPKDEASDKSHVMDGKTSPFEPPPALKEAIGPLEIAAPEAKTIFKDTFSNKEPVAIARTEKNGQKANRPVAVYKEPVQMTPAYPYSLYIGSFKTLKRANRAVSTYTRKGLRPAYNVKVSLSNGMWYRVYMGYFESSGGAERFRLDNNLIETEVKKTPYANLIGTYSSTTTLEDKIRSLKKYGFSPYVITDHGGQYRLFVGAFYPEARAEKQQQELKSMGISNKIVKR